jgi:hypothetical protein
MQSSWATMAKRQAGSDSLRRGGGGGGGGGGGDILSGK